MSVNIFALIKDTHIEASAVDTHTNDSLALKDTRRLVGDFQVAQFHYGLTTRRVSVPGSIWMSFIKFVLPLY